MIINITIEDGILPETDNFGRVDSIAADIHSIFTGNQDYVDNSILLSCNPPGPGCYQNPDVSTMNLVIATHECKDKKLALQKLRDSIDIIINHLDTEE